MNLTRGTALPEIKRIAVVGGGAAGLFSARLLGEHYDLTLFEADDRIGGHAWTVVVPEGPDAGVGLDIGFINCAHTAYPRLFGYFEHLGVETAPSDSSFCCFNAVTNEHFFFSVGAQGEAIAQRNAQLSGGPAMQMRFLKYLDKVARFYARAAEDLASGALRGLTVGEYCARAKLPADLVERFIIPTYASLWVVPPSLVPRLSAEGIYSFYRRLGLPSLKDFNSYYVKGGSRTYIAALMKDYRGQIRTSSPVAQVRRDSAGVDVILKDGSRDRFDAVVFATQADQALAMLEDPAPTERKLLGAWSYSPSRMVLHSDNAIIRKEQNGPAAWNYVSHGPVANEDRLVISYYLNRVMQLHTAESYYASINPDCELDPRRILLDITWRHPLLFNEAFATQAHLPELQGQKRSYFCGSYFASGAHEDAVRSAEAACRSLGIESVVKSWEPES